jgi:hypothetical protein
MIYTNIDSKKRICIHEMSHAIMSVCIKYNEVKQIEIWPESFLDESSPYQGHVEFHNTNNSFINLFKSIMVRFAGYAAEIIFLKGTTKDITKQGDIQSAWVELQKLSNNKIIQLILYKLLWFIVLLIIRSKYFKRKVDFLSEKMVSKKIDDPIYNKSLINKEEFYLLFDKC